MSRREGMSNLCYIYALGILPFHLSYALAILIDNFWSMALTPENSTTLRVEFSILLFTVYKGAQGPKFNTVYKRIYRVYASNR